MNEEQMNGQSDSCPSQIPESSQVSGVSPMAEQPSGPRQIPADNGAASQQASRGYMPSQSACPQQSTQSVYSSAPLMQLSGGMKFAWCVVGALTGIPGIIIAWLVNVDKMPKVKNDALKFAIIGFVVRIVLGFVIGALVGGFITMLIAGITGPHGWEHCYGSW